MLKTLVQTFTRHFGVQTQPFEQGSFLSFLLTWVSSVLWAPNYFQITLRILSIETKLTNTECSKTLMNLRNSQINPKDPINRLAHGVSSGTLSTWTLIYTKWTILSVNTNMKSETGINNLSAEVNLTKNTSKKQWKKISKL